MPHLEGRRRMAQKLLQPGPTSSDMRRDDVRVTVAWWTYIHNI